MLGKYGYRNNSFAIKSGLAEKIRQHLIEKPAVPIPAGEFAAQFKVNLVTVNNSARKIANAAGIQLIQAQKKQRQEKPKITKSGPWHPKNERLGRIIGRLLRDSPLRQIPTQKLSERHGVSRTTVQHMAKRIRQKRRIKGSPPNGGQRFKYSQKERAIIARAIAANAGKSARQISEMLHSEFDLAVPEATLTYYRKPGRQA